MASNYLAEEWPWTCTLHLPPNVGTVKCLFNEFWGDGFSYTQSRFSQKQDLFKITNKTAHILIRLSVYNCYTITILHK